MYASDSDAPASDAATSDEEPLQHNTTKKTKKPVDSMLLHHYMSQPHNSFIGAGAERLDKLMTALNNAASQNVVESTDDTTVDDIHLKLKNVAERERQTNDKVKKITTKMREARAEEKKRQKVMDTMMTDVLEKCSVMMTEWQAHMKLANAFMKYQMK